MGRFVAVVVDDDSVAVLGSVAGVCGKREGMSLARSAGRVVVVVVLALFSFSS